MWSQPTASVKTSGHAARRNRQLKESEGQKHSAIAKKIRSTTAAAKDRNGLKGQVCYRVATDPWGLLEVPARDFQGKR